MIRARTFSLAALSLLVLSGCDTSAPLAVFARDEGLVALATGQPGDEFALFAGPANGPHHLGNGRVWTTVGSEQPVPKGSGRELGHGVFPAADDHGIAVVTLVVPWDKLPEDVVVVQGVVFVGADRRQAPRGVTAAYAVRGPPNPREVWQHWLFTLLWPLRWRWLVLPALAIVVLGLRRVRIAPAPRIWRIAALLACAVWLLGERGDVPRAKFAQTGSDRAMPLIWPRGDQRQASPSSPVDRLMRPGVEALITATRELVPPTASLVVVPRSSDGPAQREAMEANWMLWPRVRAAALPNESWRTAAEYALVFTPPTPADSTATAVFKNDAGVILRLKTEEPR